jgi:sugar/nucleoside kinase (ribokinase family)
VNVVCVGDCGVDRYQPSDDQTVGGITANFARHARDHFPAADTIQIISAVGDDDAGRTVLAELDIPGLDLDIGVHPGRTPVQAIEVQPDGERLFVHYDAGVLADFRFTSTQRAAIRDADLMVAPVYLQIVGLFDELMAIDTTGKVAIDFADFLEHPDYGLLEKHIGRLDIGFFGLEAGQNLSVLQDLAREHDMIFIVTLGAAGSVALTAGDVVECAAVPAEQVVDTTGAGDAYAAGFLSRFCHGADLPDAMRYGATVAAAVVAQQGAYPPSPKSV